MENKHMMVKFRPVLTLAQLQDIAQMARVHEANIDFPHATSILRVIVPMIAKVETGAISPAYKLSETHLIKQKEKSDADRYNAGLMTQDEEMEYEAKILGV